MADIRRHLPGILACLRDHLVASSEDAAVLHADIKDALTVLLPASFGIASGHLVSAQGAYSEAIDPIIYDRTIPVPAQSDQEHAFTLRQALLAIMLAPTLDRAALDAALEAIASVKRLRPPPAVRAVRAADPPSHIARRLFPLGIVGCFAFDAGPDQTQAAMCLALDAALKRQAEYLRPLLRRSPFPQRFIVNVSASEGPFAHVKTGTHVHTNMAKAALNMLTHTAAADLAADGIFMNSVDPGWISQQMPSTDVQTWEAQQQMLPLDLIDAAARVCDPLFTATVTGQAAAGKFYKDYLPAEW